MRIPKTLIQTARSYEALPEEIKQNIEDLKSRNPDWTYRFFDDEQMKSYLRSNLEPHEWDLLQEVNPRYGVVLADFFRYLIIYKEGGVYLDVKSTATKPLTPTIDHEAAFVISQWPNKVGQLYVGYGLHPELADVPGGEFQQWNVMAEPRHPFLKAVIARVLNNIRTYTPSQFGTDAYGVLRVSGPIAFTQAVYPLLDHYPHKVVDLENWGVLYSIYDAGSNPGQSHQSRMPGHYATVREPVVLRDLYVEPPKSSVAKLSDLLAKELRDNIDLVLKLAVFSIISTATVLVLLLALVAYLAAR
jgi:hypothetical protein